MEAGGKGHGNETAMQSGGALDSTCVLMTQRQDNAGSERADGDGLWTGAMSPPRWSGQTLVGRQSHRFVGPVVLLKDLLGTILAAIGKHHYHLIAVGPGGAGLLGNRKRESFSQIYR